MTTERLTEKEILKKHFPTTQMEIDGTLQYILDAMTEFAAQEVAAIEMPTDREAFEQRAGLLDTIIKKERISLIDVGEALIYYDRWFRSRMKDAPIVTPSICPDCMAYNKETNEELIKCWNCGNSFRSRMEENK